MTQSGICGTSRIILGSGEVSREGREARNG